MTEEFLHGVNVIEVTSGAKTVRAAKSSVIGVIGTAPEADEQKFPLNKPVLIAGSLKEAAKLGKTGTLPQAVSSIFTQVGATVVVIRVKESENSDPKLKEEETLKNIIGGVDKETGEYQGIEAFLSSESIVHVLPRILIAPQFTHQLPEIDGVNPVVSALISIAEKLRSIIVADGPNTNDEEAIKWRKSVDSSRIYVVDPWVKVFIEGKEEILPSSPFVAGLIAKVDSEQGFWHSPSNKEINGIVGTSRPIDFTLGNTNCRANHLNENEVTTIIHQNGYRLWGNRTCSNDSKWAFLSVRRTADLINDSLLRAHLWAVDRNITKTYIDDVIEGVNSYLANLKAQGAIISGKCYATPELKNRADTTANKLRLLRNAIAEVGMNLGSVMLPTLKSIAEFLQEKTRYIAEFAEKYPTLTTAIMGTVASLISLKIVAVGLGYGFRGCPETSKFKHIPSLT